MLLGLSRRRIAQLIPKGSVQNINNQQFVFVQTATPDTYSMRPVRLGPEVNSRYAVLEGLTVGDRVVTEGSFLLRAEWLKRNHVSPLP